MPDKLSEIMAWKRSQLAPRLRLVSESELSRADSALPRPPPFEGALRRADRLLAVIAEIKRRSPSAGEIRPGASAPAQAAAYGKAGADALSVLTDEKYFGGSLDDLRAVSSGCVLPRLRKDFFFHPLQVLEARQAGASAVLIIVRALSDPEIERVHGAVRAAGLEALFEVHEEPEVERAVRHGARVIGVNNRDLALFRTDLGISERLIPRFPKEALAVSESGIASGADARRVRDAGASAVLVGEALMKADDPAALIAAFRGVL